MYIKDKMKKNPQNPPISPKIPSFSSSLLDEIYRSIDEGSEKSLNPKSLRNRVFEKQSIVNGEKPRRRMSENEIETLTRAYLVENWIEKNKLTHKPMWYSSSSISSDSYSSLERENPKRVNISKSEPGEYSYLENYHNSRNVKSTQENPMKSKSRALKIYTNLKKIKQPISPGGKLTNFFNSLFNNDTPKKSKNPRVSSSTEDSTCSSASSYTRSCMSRNSSNINRKFSNEEKRRVSFCPVNVIIDENKRGNEYVKGYGKFVEDEDDDMASDSSSDLFELDHLAFEGNNGRYCEELPVYETTRFHTNVAISSRLVC